MQDIWNFLAANPWIWVVGLVGLAVWIAALCLVVRSPKFRRKWLWALLCLFNFSFAWGIGPGETISIGLPAGALYVLWFWRFGPSPTAEEMASDAARRQEKRIASASGTRIEMLRAAYLVAAAASGVIAWLVVSGGLFDMFTEFAARAGVTKLPAGFEQVRTAISYGDGAIGLVLAALFVFLSFRPYWWGKLLCAWAALAWTMFGLVTRFAFGLANPIALYVLLAGAAMLVVVIVVQLVDPRFGGAYLRKAPAAA